MKDNKIKANFKLRYNIIIVLVYIIGIILLGQLFFLQIIKGSEYRETSNARLTRESVIEAARGSISDRNGKILATTQTGYSIELYKTKIDDETLNNTILKIVNLLEKNGDAYINNFPITSDYKFTISSEEKILEWKRQYNISDKASAKDCVYRFRDKYSINNTDMKEVLKIIAIRYEITTKGYSSTRSIKIAENISKTSAIQFNEQNADFPGINVITQPVRTYTSGSLAANIIGYIGKISGTKELEEKLQEGYEANDYIGRAGVEATLEKYLRGKNGIKQIDMSVDGTIEDEYVQEEAVSGNNVTLTIDSQLQGKTEDIIKDAIKSLKKLKKKSTFGSAVVMNVKSGEILAMVSYPTYKPEVFVGGISQSEWKKIDDSKALYDRSVQGSYAPGSTFKMVTATAALESKVITQSQYVNDRGVYPYPHYPVCWYYTQYHRGHGNLNIKQALQKSCNYFFYEMGRRLGIDTIEKYAKFFGLNQKTGVELPNETSGIVASKSVAESKGKSWYLSDTLSAAIGQTYNSFSPLQMARYISIIANGGNYINATVIKSIKDTDGNEIPKTEIRQYISNLLGEAKQDSNLKVNKETLSVVKAGMRLVTSPGGTAYSAFSDFKKSVAGKTGSAQAGEVTNGWFVGFTPYKNPEIAVAVILEDGATDSYAAKTARKILDVYYNIDIKADNVKENTSASAYTETQR